MMTALSLMIAQGSLGAFDTIYYHEYKARLVAGGSKTRPELWLHAVRDFVYAILFGTLPFVAWCGSFACVLACLILFEIVVTMTDFAVEPRTRAPGDVLPGERITHGLMAIVYGGVLSCLAPAMLTWWSQPTGLTVHDEPISLALKTALSVMAIGVFLSGLRDAYAALGWPGGAFPWQGSDADRRG